VEKPKLPLSCGQRVTFFAGAKKVTKETPEKNTISLQPKSVRKSVEGQQAIGMRQIAIQQLGFRTKRAKTLFSMNQGAEDEPLRCESRVVGAGCGANPLSQLITPRSVLISPRRLLRKDKR